jgi:alpha-L-fucosidase
MKAPLPSSRVKQYESLTFGMFVHWGLYSILESGEWIQFTDRIPKAEYMKLKDRFSADGFNAEVLAGIAKNAGMNYITLTTRHHDGFSLYDTKGLSDFDAPHSAAGRDIVGEFVDGCRKADIVPFFYHTTIDWHQESYRNDFDEYLEYLHKSIEILCKDYGQIGGFWFDGNWDRPQANWKEDRLYGIIRENQPQALIVNNTGLKKRGEAGHPEVDVLTFEQGGLHAVDRKDMKKYLAFELCQTLNQHWGTARADLNYISIREILENLCSCKRFGGNYLLNIGVDASGKIPDYEKAVLQKIGFWVKTYREALYETRPSRAAAAESPDFVLDDDEYSYIFIHNLPNVGPEDVTQQNSENELRYFNRFEKSIRSVIWLDNQEQLKFSQELSSGKLSVNFTGFPYGKNYVVRVAKVIYE